MVYIVNWWRFSLVWLIIINRIVNNFYCKFITEEELKLWDDLVASNTGVGFKLTSSWAKFKGYDGWQIYRIGLYERKTDNLVGGALIHEFSFVDQGQNFLYIPQGPLLNFENEERLFWQWRALFVAISKLVNVEKDMLTTHLRIEPRLESWPEWFVAMFKKAPLNLQPQFTRILDLSIDEDAFLDQMTQKGRYNVRLANKRGIVVREVEFSESNLEEFYKLYEETYSRNKFEGKDAEFFRRYFKSMKDEQGVKNRLFFAYKENVLLAAAIVITCGKEATYLYGASNSEYRRDMAPYLLHFEIWKTLKKDGFVNYDLWGEHFDSDDGEHPWAGITSFKRRFGGKRLDLVGAYDFVFSLSEYNEFIEKFER